ncbi:MAG: CBS domain-containing protein [Ilumatobacter coccineus]|uniref:CBS domain-containing protein n=1 Tax=Ilumatobacter coccineus TaxID=467094 RepID=A0A2G6KAT6_9ACTN|nr:MAG: CBS domain-containing protein [Ilumatobacter coccineus]
MFAVTPEMDETGVVKSMAIGQVMTTNPVSVERSQPLSEVYHLLRGSSFHHLPVVEGNHPVGVISSTDILKLVYDIEESSDRMLTQMLDYQFTIDDAMTTDLVTLPDTATVHDAADRLADGKFHSVLVIDLVGTLVGIVTTTDLVRFLRDL